MIVRFVKLSESTIFEEIPLYKESKIPWHAAVDGKVKTIRQTYDDIDEQNDFSNKPVVQEVNNTKWSNLLLKYIHIEFTYVKDLFLFKIQLW